MCLLHNCWYFFLFNSLILGNHIFTANVGDSRAVMYNKKSNWASFSLSHDQKPENPKELERIKKTGGRVEQYRDDDGSFIGPYRVWKKNE